MKKTIQSLFALAVAAFAFTACSDVPEPEGYNPKTGDGLVTYVPEGTGVATDPYNVAGIVDATKDLSKGETTTNDIYTKGYVSEITDFNASYGSISYSITDNAEGKSKKFIVYRGLALGNTKFAAKEDLKVGDEVIICGKVTNYKGTIEYAQGNYLVSLNGKTSGGPDKPDDDMGTFEKPYDVTSAIAAGDKTGVYVKGYIVGYAYSNQETKQTEWNFKAEGAQASNLLIAASATETDNTKCMPVNLASGSDFRKALNLLDNPGNLGKEVLLYGNFTKYFSQQGVKELSYAVFDGKEIGTKPGDNPTPSGSGINVDFKTNNLGEWTISDKNKPDAVDAIWKYNSKYGMVATAYANSTNYDSESWIISPKYDLSSLTSATLTIHHAINFFTSVDVAKTQAVVAVSTDGTNWTDLTLTGWPDKLSWTFFDSTADFSAYAGKKDVQIAVKYLSTAAKAGTWEVEKITVQ